jgi:dTDP-4-dehydrorhamnose reductase
MRILVLGVTGMLGHAVFRLFKEESKFTIIGTIRSVEKLKFLPEYLHENILISGEINSDDSLTKLMEDAKPNIVINCIGLVKQLTEASLPISAISINALLPHRLSQICGRFNARLIHISTDCVFSGDAGMYSEESIPDARDMYGQTKFLGEVFDQHAITLRSLIDWFLAQNTPIKGFQSAIFSGLPTVELARVIRDFVIPNPKLSGLFHVSSNPISKFDLLKIVAKEYKKEIEIIPDSTYRINRSLDSSKFKLATGFTPKPWNVLVANMHDFD